MTIDSSGCLSFRTLASSLSRNLRAHLLTSLLVQDARTSSDLSERGRSRRHGLKQHVLSNPNLGESDVPWHGSRQFPIDSLLADRRPRLGIPTRPLRIFHRRELKCFRRNRCLRVKFPFLTLSRRRHLGRLHRPVRMFLSPFGPKSGQAASWSLGPKKTVGLRNTPRPLHPSSGGELFGGLGGRLLFPIPW